MENNVIISICGIQAYQDTEDDQIELVTEGSLTREGEGWNLSYEESPLTGLDGTTTTFQIEGGRVTLLRTGAVCSQMVFEEKRRHLSMYNTPYGAMAVGVNTRHVKSSIGESGGDIEIDYAIEIDHAIAGRNSFQINVRESQGGLRLPQ